MVQANKSSGDRKRKGYSLKVKMGLVPHRYDKDSRSFQQGAWKHWNRGEQHALRRAMGQAE